jgi:hypothetical protein
MIHAKAMGIVVAYDIYKELAEGNLDATWKLDPAEKNGPVDFYEFRQTLSRQMVSYNPDKKHYLGDDKLRVNTVQTKAKRARSPVPQPQEDGIITRTGAGVTESTLKDDVAKLRLCGFIGGITEHYDACETMEEKKKLKCAFCGKPAYQYCALCKVGIHKYSKIKGVSSCFFRYHDTGCFGLAREDWKITNKKMKDWTYPTMAEMKSNEAQMKQLSKQVDSADNGDSDDDNSG